MNVEELQEWVDRLDFSDFDNFSKEVFVSRKNKKLTPDDHIFIYNRVAARFNKELKKDKNLSYRIDRRPLGQFAEEMFIYHSFQNRVAKAWFELYGRNLFPGCVLKHNGVDNTGRVIIGRNPSIKNPDFIIWNEKQGVIQRYLEFKEISCLHQVSFKKDDLVSIVKDKALTLCVRFPSNRKFNKKTDHPGDKYNHLDLTHCSCHLFDFGVAQEILDICEFRSLPHMGYKLGTVLKRDDVIHQFLGKPQTLKKQEI